MVGLGLSRGGAHFEVGPLPTGIGVLGRSWGSGAGPRSSIVGSRRSRESPHYVWVGTVTAPWSGASGFGRRASGSIVADTICAVRGRYRSYCGYMERYPIGTVHVMNNGTDIVPRSYMTYNRYMGIYPTRTGGVHDSLTHLHRLLDDNTGLCTSVTPDFINCFRNVAVNHLTTTLEGVNFAKMSRATRKTRTIDTRIAECLGRGNSQPLIVSDTYPTTISVIRGCFPSCTGYVSPVPSPLHTRYHLLGRTCKSSVGMIFFNPYTTGGGRTSASPSRVTLSMVFPILRRLLSRGNVALSTVRRRSTLTLNLTTRKHFCSIRNNVGSALQSNGSGIHCLSISNLSGLHHVLSSPPPRGGASEAIFLRMLTYRNNYMGNPTVRDNARTLRTVFSASTDTTVQLDTSHTVRPRPLGTRCGPSRVVPPTPGRRRVVGTLAEINGFAGDSRLGYKTYNCGAYHSFTVTVLRNGTRRTVYRGCLHGGFRHASGTLVGCVPTTMMVISSGLRVARYGHGFTRLMNTASVCSTVNGLGALPVTDCLRRFTSLFVKTVHRNDRVRGCRRRLNRHVMGMDIFPVTRNGITKTIVRSMAGGRFHHRRVTRGTQSMVHGGICAIRRITQLFKRRVTRARVVLGRVTNACRTRATPRARNAVPPNNCGWTGGRREERGSTLQTRFQ